MQINEILVNLIIGILGAIIYATGVYLVGRIRENRNPYTGKWESRIYDDSGRIVKKDIWNLRQKGKEFKGTVYRIEPKNQSHRFWNMKGRIIDRNFFAIFWSKDENIKSYGCWFMRQEDDFLLKGKYLSLQEDNGFV
ncbi:MAG: hypothetical protein H6559_20495 [Lewinellaceae bacterium]|nr:hypothetical protein [candidate division KSB1 bacterium]MCB9295478.1 hypothetical protein [Lewinellaceae bacterium]